MSKGKHMNRESLQTKLAAARNLELDIVGPSDVTPEIASRAMIGLLQAIYTEHALSNDRQTLIATIDSGTVLPWFARLNNETVATASLIQQQNGAWEIGRCVALQRGKGIGTAVILQAVLHHLDHHPHEALVAEVRAPQEFAGIPSGEATQRIFLGEMIGLVPHAIAPLFAHGDPLRNEPFILAASDVKPGKTISERIAEALRGRSTEGTVVPLRVVHETPFRLVVPDPEGKQATEVMAERIPGCTLFPIEAVDAHMPLLGLLANTPGIVFCGVDRLPGQREHKPIILAASFLGGDNNERLLAPAQVSEVLPGPIRRDLQQIADQFLL